MSFMIRMLSENSQNLPLQGIDIRLGEITLDEYVEKFEALIGYWAAEDYQQHWKQALERIIGGEEKSCLITSILNPESANFIVWWPIYREGKRVFLQNQLLLLEETPSFNPMDPYKSIQDRQTFTEEGFPISEWEVSVNDLELFLQSSWGNQK